MRRWQYEPARDLNVPPGERAASLDREPGLFEALAHRASWEVIHVYLKTHQDLHIAAGREYLPSAPPFVLVSNHSSHLDALVLGAILPARLRGEAYPLAAGDTFFANPISAALAALTLNALPLWRDHCGHRQLQTLRERLVQGHACYIIFPEGTRSRTGKIGVFKSGIGVMVAGTEVPVIPCYLAGTHQAWPPQATRPHAGRVTVQVAPPMRFDDVPNVKDGWRYVAKQLAAAIEGLATQQEDGAGRPGEE